MTTYTTTPLTYADGLQTLTMTKVSISASSDECCADVSAGGAGPALLLIDATNAGTNITVTLHAGDGPAAAGDRAIDLEQLKFAVIPVDTAALVRADGKIYFKIEAESSLATANIRIGVLLQRNVTAY